MGAADAYITVAGIDVTTHLRQGTVQIEKNLNNNPDSCTFTWDGAPGPISGQSMLAALGATPTPTSPVLLFGGTIVTVDSLYEGLTTNLSWHVTVKDPTYLLNRRYPIGNFTGPADQVILAIVAQFSSGFTTNNVQVGMPSITITLDGTSDFGSCLTDIMNLAVEGVVGSAFWDADYYMDIHAGIT